MNTPATGNASGPPSVADRPARGTSITFTPGPWSLETVKTSCGICHKVGPFPYRAGRQNHACIYVDYPSGAMGSMEAELKANATLIAAAPSLYEALRELLVAVRFADPPRDFGAEAEPNLCHEARIPIDFVTVAESALALARGETVHD